MSINYEWLLEGDAWIQYNTRKHLLHQSEDDPQVSASRRAMLEHPQIKHIIQEIQEWPWLPLTNHKAAAHPIHKLTFLADIGINYDDPGIDTILNHILENQSAEGPFQVLMNIHKRFGGSGQDQYSWLLCDAPLLSYALARMGLANEARVHSSVEHLVNMASNNGWPCGGSPINGKFRGPGKKDDPCPYATLIMVKTLALYPELHSHLACQQGVETLLTLWQESLERRPYLFKMGTDFRKLKAPLVWYDIVHVLDVLSHFEWIREDDRFLNMLDIIKQKANEQGRFTPESIWTTWKGWGFCQKREPSRWLTYLVWQIDQRISQPLMN